MRNPKERRAGRLFPFPVFGKWWLAAGILIIAYFHSAEIQQSFHRPSQEGEASAKELPPANLAMQSGLQAEDEINQSAPPVLKNSLRDEIDKRFLEIEVSPDKSKEKLLSLKRLLQQTFQGQEDCWSCEGTEYFNRFDRMAGSGEARKPIGFREWIELGDDAVKNKDLDSAKEFYAQALDVLEERSPDSDSLVDPQMISHVREKCQNLNCR